jgi:hypothetical protein
MAGTDGLPVVDGTLRARLQAVCDEGWDLWSRFDIEVRQDVFHAFVAADYEGVWQTLERLRRPGLRFVEWGSATGVITILADLLGYEACGIEIDEDLVAAARDLSARHGSSARFVEGSFIPGGYRMRPQDADACVATVVDGEPGYPQLARLLEDFDLVFVFPWPGEEGLMLDIMRSYGGAAARLLLHGVSQEIDIYERGPTGFRRSPRP